MIVTAVPIRAKNWPNSRATGPPPSTTIDAGRSRRSSKVSLVRYPVSCNPGTDISFGTEPVAMTKAFLHFLRPDPDSVGREKRGGALIELVPRVPQLFDAIVGELPDQPILAVDDLLQMRRHIDG